MQMSIPWIPTIGLHSGISLSCGMTVIDADLDRFCLSFQITIFQYISSTHICFDSVIFSGIGVLILCYPDRIFYTIRLRMRFEASKYTYCRLKMQSLIKAVVALIAPPS